MSVDPVLTPGEVGPMVSGYAVEQAIEAVLRDWFTAYLCEAERQHGLDAGLIAWPRGWAHSGADLEKMPQDQLPALVIMAGGIVNSPVRTAMPVTVGRSVQLPTGNLAATFGVEVAAVINAAWDTASRRNAQLYAVALRDCLTQRPLAIDSEVRAVGERYDELDFERTRTYSASVVSFNVAVESIGWTDGGPPPSASKPDDPTQPFTPWPVVASSDVEVDKYPLDAPIPEEAEQ